MTNHIRHSLERVRAVLGLLPSGSHRRCWVPPVVPRVVREQPTERDWARCLEAAPMRRPRGTSDPCDDRRALVPAYVLSPDEFTRFRRAAHRSARGAARGVSG